MKKEQKERIAAATKQSELIEAAPQSTRGTLEKAFAGVCSPRAAIKAKCLTCCNFERAEITGCTVVLCPLHAYRPFQPKEDREATKLARAATKLASVGASSGGTPAVGTPTKGTLATPRRSLL